MRKQLFESVVEAIGKSEATWTLRLDCDVEAKWLADDGQVNHWCMPDEGYVVLEIGDTIQLTIQGADALRMLVSVEPFIEIDGNFFDGDHCSADKKWMIPVSHGDRYCSLDWDVGGIVLSHGGCSIDITSATAKRIYEALAPLVAGNPYPVKA